MKFNQYSDTLKRWLLDHYSSEDEVKNTYNALLTEGREYLLLVGIDIERLTDKQVDIMTEVYAEYRLFFMAGELDYSTVKKQHLDDFIQAYLNGIDAKGKQDMAVNSVSRGIMIYNTRGR